jgi:hypothetical protein
LILVDIGSSMSNGLNNEANDAASLAGTTKAGASSGWINASAAGGVAGVSGQSTLSRKSGKEILTHPFDLFVSS